MRRAVSARWPSSPAPPPAAGDIVAYRPSAAQARVCGSDFPLVHRVIGVAGDSVRIAGERLVVDGEAVEIAGAGSPRPSPGPGIVG